MNKSINQYSRTSLQQPPSDRIFWPLFGRGRCGEVFNKRILVNGSEVRTGKHGRLREVAVVWRWTLINKHNAADYTCSFFAFIVLFSIVDSLFIGVVSHSSLPQSWKLILEILKYDSQCQPIVDSTFQNHYLKEDSRAVLAFGFEVSCVKLSVDGRK